MQSFPLDGRGFILHLTGMTWLQKAIDRAGGWKAVALAVGLSPKHVANLYRGSRPLTLDSVNALAPVLDVADDVWQAALRSRPPRKRPTPAAATTPVTDAA